MSEAPTAPYGAGDPFPKPILQTRFETVDDGGELEYSQAKAVAITAIVGTGIWVLGFLYVLIAVLTHGNA
jgi:hypothetical protein